MTFNKVLFALKVWKSTLVTEGSIQVETFNRFSFASMASVKRLWNLTFKIICFVGFSYQLQSIMISYFLFGTVTKTQIAVPEFTVVPSLHYCFLCLNDFINITAIERKYKIKAGERNNEVFKLMDHISVADMFEYTPNEPVEKCVIRDKSGNALVHATKEMCNSIFKTTKYIVQQYVCYKSEPVITTQYRTQAIVSSLRTEKMIYEISLKNIFSASRKVRTIVTAWRYPLLENIFAPGFYKKDGEPFTLQVSCSNISTKLLGYPYDKFMCHREGEFDFYQCRDNCMEQKILTSYGRLPFTSFYNDSFSQSSYKLVSEEMLRNVTTSTQIARYQEDCHNGCPTHPCHYSYCLTTVDSAKSTFNSLSSFRVETPANPTSFVTSYPQVPLLDFIIYVLSSLGTWFGFVIISCNPVNLMKTEEELDKNRLNHMEVQMFERFKIVHRRNLARNRFYSQIRHR